MKNLAKYCLVFVLVAVLLAACGGPNYNLFGSWRESQSGSLIEFRQDGTMRIPQSAGIAEVKYIFSDQDKNTILIAPSPDTAADQMVKWAYTIDGDTLTLHLQSQDQTTGQVNPQNVILKRVK